MVPLAFLVLFSILQTVNSQQATIQFQDTSVSIEEGAVGIVRLRKIGTASTPISVVVQVSGF